MKVFVCKDMVKQIIYPIKIPHLTLVAPGPINKSMSLGFTQYEKSPSLLSSLKITV